MVHASLTLLLESRRHGQDRLARCARTQFEEPDPRDPEEPPGGDHRRFGLGQVFAGFRYPLRGGAAALRRVAFHLCAAVPPADGEARRRLDRRFVAGDFDRAEIGVAQPAFDRRHGHRDPRLPAAAFRFDRRAALPERRHRHPAADRAADGRPGARPAAQDQAADPRPLRARQKGRIPQAAAADVPRRFRAGADRRRNLRPLRRAAGARQAEETRHRPDRRPAGGQGRARETGRQLARNRLAGGRRPGGAGGRRAAGRADVAELLLPAVRLQPARNFAAAFLLQQPARRLSGLLRPRQPDGGRRRQGGGRARAVDRRRRHRPLAVGHLDPAADGRKPGRGNGLQPGHPRGTSCR